MLYIASSPNAGSIPYRFASSVIVAALMASVGVLLPGARHAEAQFICEDNLSGTAAGATATGANATACGPNADGNGVESVSIGNNTEANGEAAIAIGSDPNGSGLGTRADGDSSIAIGGDADATGSNSIAIGDHADATGNGSVALGGDVSGGNLGAQALAPASTALGANAWALGVQSTAVGSGAVANHNYSAAFGGGATTTRPYQLMFGTAINTYTMPGITSAASQAAQGTPTHIVTSNASGDLAAYTPAALGLATTSDLSSFNSRLNRVGRDASHALSGVAMAFAMAGAPNLQQHENYAISLNYGFFESHQGIALNGAARLDDRTQLSAGIAYGPDEDLFGGQVGVRFGW